MLQHEAILTTVANHLRQAERNLQTGAYDAAMTSVEQAIRAAREQEHVPSLAAAYYGMASVIWGSGGSSDDAHRYASLAAQHTRANTSTDLLVRTLIARIKLARGNFEAAILLNEDLLKYYWENQRLDGVADVLRSLGDVYMAKGEYNTAYERYYEALRLYRNDLDDPLNHAGLLVSLGSLMYQTDRREEAMQFWSEARTIAEDHGFRHIITGLDQAMEELDDRS